MKFLVKATVNVDTMLEFGKKLQNNELDRSYIRGETYCTKDNPAVGYSIWEADSREEFEEKFAQWKQFYLYTETYEVISPGEAMKLLMADM
ncbi:hypothetical protein JW960_22890 [candidate division KSB1 bacterium]|nr:hypothetical protein [candidate division KSB1 bacterium]